MTTQELIKNKGGKGYSHKVRDTILIGLSKSLLEGFLRYCAEEGNSITTINLKGYVIKKFLIETDFNSLSRNKIIEYLNNKKSNLSYISYSNNLRLIRTFFNWGYINKMITKEILNIVPIKIKTFKEKHIPSVFSKDEINQLLTSSKNLTSELSHFRNYSILCLITYSGIRAMDVIQLKIENIDWVNNQISFIQHKTKRKHIIPLIAEIGNPLMEYLLNERLKKTSNYLYLDKNGERIKSSQVITSIIQKYFKNSKIDLKNRHYGPHALRHSMASRLINNTISPFSVANVLGHSSIDSVHIYAKVNLESLRKCVLEAPYEI